MLDFRTTFLLQTIFGILGNFCILYHYFIVRNLITANILVLFSTGFHSEKFGVAPHGQWFYLQIFPVCSCGGQGSVHWYHLPLECLPGHQISPRTSRWAKLKVNALKCFVPPVILCWILNMLVNVIYPTNESITNRKSFRHCSAVCHDQTRDTLNAALLSFPDVLCFVLMILASGSTVFILYRHKQRVQNIHRISVPSVSSLESRATETVLLVAGTFVYFNTLSSICYITLGVLNNFFFLKTSAINSSCFPTVSPFQLMSCDSRMSRLCFAGVRNKNSPNPMRKM
uniref:Vomeronasal type-1 receptor n=1 Tax=Balaenoptera musculus TaxID=9771 RepID=A0A8C0DVT5_BALMU